MASSPTDIPKPSRYVSPMLATSGVIKNLQSDGWAFEGKWDGHRMIVKVGGGQLSLWSRNGHDVTDQYPQLGYLRDTLAAYPATLDGEVVALDGLGIPSLERLQNRTSQTNIEFWAFDILALYGKSVMRAQYQNRRKLLVPLRDADLLKVPPPVEVGCGEEAMEYSRQMGMEGIVAKQLEAGYRPNCRVKTWIKEKHYNMQEVVIGGYTEGSGNRAGTIGALLMGTPGPAGLQFVGRVGSGFTDKDLDNLKKSLTSLRCDGSPFSDDLSSEVRSPVFVNPVLVGEVVYLERTLSGKLREPSWRGLRLDKSAEEVVKEI